MNFGKFDAMLLLSMSIAIVVMSFTFPALGLTGDNASENDIPEYNISNDRFDFAGEPPDSPGGPALIYLRFRHDLGGDSDNVIWLEGGAGGDNDGVEVTLINETSSVETMEVTVNNWTNGVLTGQDKYVLNQSETASHTNFSYDILFTYTRIDDRGEPTERATIQGEIRTQPENQQWYDRIPVLGTVFSAGADLPGIVGWIGAMFLWVNLWAIDWALNGWVLIIEVSIYFIDLFHFFFSTYNQVVSGAPSWATVIVAIPGIALAIEFAKIVALLIEILWIG